MGYYSRARNLQKAARLICEELSGKFPRDLGGVLELPGVGRYTAGAICSIAYNQPEPLVDGNVARVLTRLLGIERPSKQKQVVEQHWLVTADLVKHAVGLQRTSQRNAAAFNQAMMELGALICTPRNPLCHDCPLKGHCIARKQNKVNRIPVSAKGAPVSKRRFIGFIIAWHGNVFVQRRPSGEVNSGFWEFPNWLVDDTQVQPADLATTKLALGQVECVEQLDGYVRCRFANATSADAREKIFGSAQERGWLLRELTRQAPSLEDLFVNLTRGKEDGK